MFIDGYKGGATPVKKKVFDDWNAYLEVSDSSDPSSDRVSFDSRRERRTVTLSDSLEHQPAGVETTAVEAGVKAPGILDFTVVRLARPGAAAAVFTRSLCPSYAVEFDKRVLADGRAQLLAVVSKNANVFTPTGEADTATMARWLAEE